MRCDCLYEDEELLKWPKEAVTVGLILCACRRKLMEAVDGGS